MKHKLNPKPADKDDPVYKDETVRAVTIKKMTKEERFKNCKPAPKDHPVYTDTSARVKPPIPRKRIKTKLGQSDPSDPIFKSDEDVNKAPQANTAKIEINMTVDDYMVLESQRKLALEELERFNKLNHLAGYPVLSDLDMAVYGASTMERLENIRKEIRDVTDYAIEALQIKMKDPKSK